MSIKIITDSTSDISKEQAKQWGVEIVPLTVNFGTEEYVDGVTLSASEFYSKLESSDNLPTTSQVTVNAFEKCFRNALVNSDEVLCITLSSNLSGTYQSAQIAKDIIGTDNIHLVDSQTVTMGLALLVSRAVELRDRGLGAKAIAEELLDLSNKIRIYAMIDTLKYLQKGGRLSAAGAIVGTMLNIKPIIIVKNGKLEVVQKVRGVKQALEGVISAAERDNPDLSLGFSFAHANLPEQMETLMNLVPEWKSLNRISCEIGSVVGTHAGPGCAGLAFFIK